MQSSGVRPATPSWRALILAMAGWAGLAACMAMVFLAMRSVMDVGGSCADGGPYVSAQSCPEGSAPALMLGIFGGVVCAFVATIGGAGLGGFWMATPVLAWSALFGSLGWNFMDYGVFSAPDGIEWGWAICGILFWAMAFGPLAGVLLAVRGAGRGRPDRGRGTTPAAPDVEALPGPGQPPRTREPEPRPSAPSRALAPAPSPPTAQERALAGIASDFGAVVARSMEEITLADTADGEPPADGLAGAPGAAGAAPSFTEGTQALLDRLERLADMRDRGLLDSTEYETAKAAIMAELEERS